MDLRYLSCLTLLMAACGGAEKPQIVRFAADRAEVPAGETVTLSFEVTAATKVVITQAGATIFDMAQGSGTVTSRPIDEATQFELIASGEGEARQAIMVGATGVRVVSFTASPSEVELGAPVTLSWVLGGAPPSAVRIVDATNTEVYAGTQIEGSRMVSPTESTTYTLSVEAGGATASATAQVTVTTNSVLPRIVSVTAQPTMVAIGNNVDITWETEFADEVQVSQDGVVARPWNRAGAARGNVRLPVNAAQSSFLFEARNANGKVDQTLSVVGLPVPVINEFSVTPMSYAQASTVATVRWRATETDRMRLELNNQPVMGFPANTFMGSYQVDITGEARLRLIATNAVGETTRSAMVTLGFNEREPNNTPRASIPVAGDGVGIRGTLSSTTDVDLYAVMVPQGARIYARAGWDATARRCLTDTVLSLLDTDGSTVRGSVDNTTVPDIAPCSEINPLLASWADNLPAGTYYVRVGAGNRTAPGNYHLVVTVILPAQPFPGVTYTPTGNPVWEPVDAQFFVGNVGDMGQDLYADVNRILSPFHVVAGDGGNFGFVTRPATPLVRDYRSYLSTALAVNGYENRSTIDPADITLPFAIYNLFALVPRAGAATGQSFDSASGPIIENALFPIDVQLVIELAAEQDDDPYELVAYTQFMPPIPSEGASHRILGSWGTFQDSAPSGAFALRYSLMDASGAGWTVRVPFTVR